MTPTPLSVMSTPMKLAEITLPAPAAVPPMVTPAVPTTATPSPPACSVGPLPMPKVPVASVPM